MTDTAPGARNFVRVLLFGSAAELLDCREVGVAVPDEGLETTQIIQIFVGPPHREAFQALGASFAVNGKVVEASYVLKPGDELSILPPVSGG